MNNIKPIQISQQIPAHKNVIHSAGIPLVIVSVALTGRQLLCQHTQPRAFQDIQRTGKLKIIQIPQHNHIRIRIYIQNAGRTVFDKVRHNSCLLIALRLTALTGRLVYPKQRLICQFSIKVIHNGKNFLPVEHKLPRQRLATAIKPPIRRFNSPWTCRQFRRTPIINNTDTRHSTPAGTIRKTNASRIEQEPNANIPSRFAAIGVIHGVNLAELVSWPTGILNRCYQHSISCAGVNHRIIRRAVTVLDFLNREDIRRLEIADNSAGEIRKFSSAVAWI